ncbi:glucosyl transferase [Ignavibacterium sp.]|uniref:glucosyl transferase n=1 Tax=Ignavibacterium sp. TaxID=2651167 RepID=UPI002203D6A7|nr:glucosyl transferase [Ignavibacterium sp.]BDQ03915.1 MAG: hypothetical protein KatS3mg037_2490 [Ignavibacterium sp.]
MKSKTYMPLLTLIIQLLLFATSCKQTTEPKLEAELKLELEDVSCTEAWIKLTTTNLQLPATMNLLQDGNLSETISLLSADTLLYVDSLLPNKTYKFQATIQLYLPKAGIQPFNHSGFPAEGRHSSNELTVTTMDTTSHDFTWQSWEFGQHSSSTLYDVAIIDENNIWAVGEIYMLDSLGNPDPNAYNAVHWDGTKWELKRIYFYTFCGQQSMGSYPAKSIFAFGPNDIWIGMDGSQVVRWNGQSQSEPICTPVSINKLWGSSSEDLYAVGNNGNIAHWDGVKWTKIESGTDVDLLDVWGSVGETIWACGYNSSYALTVLLRYVGKNSNKVYEGSPNNQNNNEYIGPISGVWSNSKFFTYVASWGKIYRQPDSNILNIKRVTPNFSDVAFTIRGTAHNNIFISGQHSLIGHFNGVTYKEITELKNQDRYLLKIDTKNKLLVAVGYSYYGIVGSTAVIYIINII